MPVQEVLIKFKADTSEIAAATKDIESNLRKADNINIEPVSEDAVSNVKEVSKGLSDLGKAADTTTTKTKSLKAQLKEMKAELAALELAGKTNTKQFRETAAAAGALEDQIGDINSRVKALASDTPKLDALISGATGIAGGFSVAQGAVALFGDENEELNKALLKVQATMAITNGLQAVAQTLNKDSAFSVIGLGKAQLFLNTAMNAFPLVFIVTALAAVAGGLFLLFTNQSKAADGLVNFTEKIGLAGRAALAFATLGLSEVTLGIAKLSQMMRSTEDVAHEAMLNVADAFLDSSQKQIDSILKTREAITGRYDLEIRLAKASGKDTEDIERKKLEFIIKSLDQEYAIRLAQAERVRQTLIDNGAGATAALKRITDQQAQNTKKALQTEKDNLLVFNAEQLKADEDAAKERADKAKEGREKAFNDKIAALELEKKEAEKLVLETATTEEEANDMRNQNNIDFINKRIEILKEFGKGIIDEEIALLNGVQKIEDDAIAKRLKSEEKQKELQEKLTQQTKDADAIALEVMEEGAEKQKALRIKQFEDKILELETQGVLTAELEKKLQEKLFEELREIDEKEAKDRNDRLIKEIEQRKKLIDAGIKTFEDGISIISDLITLSNLDAAQAAEFQKTLAVFQVGLDLAKSLATVISSATTAAAATGPLAPITLAGYIASGVAAITGAFVQVKAIFDAPVPKPAAKGEERVTGGRKGVDSVLYNLMPDERVLTAETNMKYWDELHAMHMGSDYFDKLVNMKYVQPAVQEILSNSNSGGGMNNGIMGSLMLNGKWKGQNIVGALNQGAKQNKKQHKEMMEALKPKRISKRRF